MTQPRPSRRILFQGMSALGVAAVLAGCGGGDDNPAGGDAGGEATPGGSPSPTRSPSESSSASASASTKPTMPVLATADEVPVGGGIVLTKERIVVTQPARGTFAAYSAVCTHQGETVGSVVDNTITCAAHGSQ